MNCNVDASMNDITTKLTADSTIIINIFNAWMILLQK